ncbi:hypothetical protein AVEN_20019-1 [Araneus ventricosus]|uniref:Uncharacterized protein n=1 Tax=Araneus ventricosus TaxID=182803 RepID=A0A4Y2J6Q3_ARAVE|nr:hypothetical protein AVEN_20019-1 [Araneus ventricosus]
MTRAAPRLEPRLQASHHTSGKAFYPLRLINRPTYTADHQWNRVSNLELSDHEAKTLPLGHVYKGARVQREVIFADEHVVTYVKRDIHEKAVPLYLAYITPKTFANANLRWEFVYEREKLEIQCSSFTI